MVPDTGNATWQVIAVYPTSGPPHNFISCNQVILEYTLTGKDTLIGGEHFKIINRKTSNKSDAVSYNGNIPCPLPLVDPFTPYLTDKYYTAIREVNKRVYVAGWGNAIFFDFNLEVGQGSMDYSGVVYKIDTISLNGSLRKRFIMSTYSGADTVIEGIGSMRRGGIKVTDFPNSKNALTICHASNQNKDYSHPIVSCTQFYSFPATVNSNAHEPIINLSPNPFRNKLYISAKIAADAYIYNGTGQLIWNDKIRISTTIQTSNFMTGLYFLVLKNDSGQIIKTEKLIKE